MSSICKKCGGRGTFKAIEPILSNPKPVPPYYDLIVNPVAYPCSCCNGRGKDCGCGTR